MEVAGLLGHYRSHRDSRGCLVISRNGLEAAVSFFFIMHFALKAVQRKLCSTAKDRPGNAG